RSRIWVTDVTRPFVARYNGCGAGDRARIGRAASSRRRGRLRRGVRRLQHTFIHVSGAAVATSRRCRGPGRGNLVAPCETRPTSATGYQTPPMSVYGGAAPACQLQPFSHTRGFDDSTPDRRPALQLRPGLTVRG